MREELEEQARSQQRCMEDFGSEARTLKDAAASREESEQARIEQLRSELAQEKELGIERLWQMESLQAEATQNTVDGQIFARFG